MHVSLFCNNATYVLGPILIAKVCDCSAYVEINCKWSLYFGHFVFCPCICIFGLYCVPFFASTCLLSCLLSYIYHLWLFYWFLIVWDMFLMGIESLLALNMHYWWFCDDLTNARYLFILLCIVKSKFFTINVSIVDMRSLYYQLIVIVVCYALANSVFFAVIYLFIILDVCEGPLLYGVLVKYVVLHPSVPGSSSPVFFRIFFVEGLVIIFPSYMYRDENEFMSSFAFLITIVKLTSLLLMVDLFIALFPVFSWVMS